MGELLNNLFCPMFQIPITQATRWATAPSPPREAPPNNAGTFYRQRAGPNGPPLVQANTRHGWCVDFFLRGKEGKIKLRVICARIQLWNQYVTSIHAGPASAVPLVLDRICRNIKIQQMYGERAARKVWSTSSTLAWPRRFGRSLANSKYDFCPTSSFNHNKKGVLTKHLLSQHPISVPDIIKYLVWQLNPGILQKHFPLLHCWKANITLF